MNIIIAGSSGHAKVIIDVVEKQGKFKIVGLLDSYRQPGETTMGYPVLGSERDLPELAKKHHIEGCLVAVGDNWGRQQFTQKIRTLMPSLRFVTAIHPSAAVGREVELGDGTVVMAGAVINSGTRTGEGVIVNTCASVDHDCHLGSFSSIAPGATLGGNVRVGEGSAICIGATVKNALSIGEGTVVGAGAVVLHDLDSGVLAYGVPARVIRARKPIEKYL